MEYAVGIFAVQNLFRWNWFPDQLHFDHFSYCDTYDEFRCAIDLYMYLHIQQLGIEVFDSFRLAFLNNYFHLKQLASYVSRRLVTDI